MSLSPGSHGEGKRDRRLQTRPHASLMPTSKLNPQSRMTPTMRTPVHKQSGELERPRSRKWSRNDRVPLDDVDMNHIRRRNQ